MDFSPETREHFISEIYEGIDNPALWSGVLEGLSKRLGLAGALISEIEIDSGDFRVLASADIDPAKTEHHFFSLHSSSLHTSAASGDNHLLSSRRETDGAGLEAPFQSISTVALDESVQTILDNGFHTFIPLLAVENGNSTKLHLIRHKWQGALDKNHLDVIYRFVPHLRRAIRIRQDLTLAAPERDAILQVLDRIPIGIALLQGDGRVRLMNEAARKITSARDGLTLENGSLCAASKEERKLFDRITRQSARRESAPRKPPGNSLTISRPSGKKPFTLMVTSYGNASWNGKGNARLAAVFISDPGRRPDLNRAALATLFGLTPKEIALLQSLTSGLSLENVARERKVSLNTVRTQLKEIFSKTGTNRQSELLGFVLSSVAALADAPQAPAGDLPPSSAPRR